MTIKKFNIISYIDEARILKKLDIIKEKRLVRSSDL